jgi:hypothetical protein
MIGDKNYKEIQEMINDCICEGDMSKLATITRELLEAMYYQKD